MTDENSTKDNHENENETGLGSFWSVLFLFLVAIALAVVFHSELYGEYLFYKFKSSEQLHVWECKERLEPLVNEGRSGSIALQKIMVLDETQTNRQAACQVLLECLVKNQSEKTEPDNIELKAEFHEAIDSVCHQIARNLNRHKTVDPVAVASLIEFGLFRYSIFLNPVKQNPAFTLKFRFDSDIPAYLSLSSNQLEIYPCKKFQRSNRSLQLMYRTEQVTGRIEYDFATRMFFKDRESRKFAKTTKHVKEWLKACLSAMKSLSVSQTLVVISCLSNRDLIDTDSAEQLLHSLKKKGLCSDLQYVFGLSVSGVKDLPQQSLERVFNRCGKSPTANAKEWLIFQHFLAHVPAHYFSDRKNKRQVFERLRAETKTCTKVSLLNLLARSERNAKWLVELLKLKHETVSLLDSPSQFLNRPEAVANHSLLRSWSRRGELNDFKIGLDLARFIQRKPFLCAFKLDQAKRFVLRPLMYLAKAEDFPALIQCLQDEIAFITQNTNVKIVEEVLTCCLFSEPVLTALKPKLREHIDNFPESHRDIVEFMTAAGQ